MERSHAEALARDIERAQSVNGILLGGLGVVVTLGCSLLLLALLHDARQLRRAPPQVDSEVFAAGLRAASRRFKNPRQRVRFRNLARLAYHLVAAARPVETPEHGWEGAFFSILATHVLGGQYSVLQSTNGLGESSRWPSGRPAGRATQRALTAHIGTVFRRNGWRRGKEQRHRGRAASGMLK